MCEEDSCVGLGQERGCLREGWGICLKYLKKGQKKEGKGKKDIKKGAMGVKDRL